MSQGNRKSENSSAVVSGIVHLIEETKTFGAKGFRKRLVVLEQDNGRFQSFIPVDFIQESCDSVDEMNVGDQVEISYRLTGRKWQKDPKSEVKFFLSAEATGFNVLSGGNSKSAKSSGDPNMAFSEAAEDGGFDEGDVPF